MWSHLCEREKAITTTHKSFLVLIRVQEFSSKNTHSLKERTEHPPIVTVSTKELKENLPWNDVEKLNLIEWQSTEYAIQMRESCPIYVFEKQLNLMPAIFSTSIVYFICSGHSQRLYS